MSTSVRNRLFGIDPRETMFSTRGFWAGNAQAVVQLERAGSSFVEGYHLALDQPEANALGLALAGIDREWQGFAFEGAGMALALLDSLTPWNRNRLNRFLSGPGDPHTYMVNIGAGWAWARLGRRLAPVERGLSRLHPILGWLALDGFGFHEGYFHPDRTVEQQRRPVAIRGYCAKVFDSGLGRSLWFVCGADPERLAALIAGFDKERRSDLWAGVGLACTYACGVSETDIESLVEFSGTYRASLAQGSAFAAKARERADVQVPHTAMVVARICATPPELAAKVCDVELANVLEAGTFDDGLPVFEHWRLCIQRAFQRNFLSEGA